MFKKYLLLLFLLILYSADTRSVNFTKFDLSPYVTQHNWQQVQQIIKGQPITQLIFQNVAFCNQAFKRLLNMQQIKNSLTSLVFDGGIFFNEDTFKILWGSKCKNNLIKLKLDVNNMEDKDLLLFPNETELNIQELSLQSAFIGAEGFKYLANLKLNKLKSLNIYGLSLVTEQSVNNFLTMNLTRITDLNFGSTSVSSINAMRIFNILKVQNLVNLNISSNNFQASFYRNFSKLNFNFLQSLDLSGLIIDQTAIGYFNNLKFPQLTTLNMGGNQIFIDGLYTFLNKKNYPKLTKLRIHGTIIQANFFKYLANQFNQTQFEQLQFNDIGIEPQILIHLQKLNLQKLQKLTINRGLMKPQYMQQFLKTKKLSQLKQLNLLETTNTGRIFSVMLEKQWPKLKILKLNRPGKINFLQLKTINITNKFPMLENVKVNCRNYNPTQVRQLVHFISRLSHQLIKFQIIYNKPHKIVRQLSQNMYNAIPKQLIISIFQQVSQRLMSSGYTLLFQAFLSPNQKPNIYVFTYYKIFKQQYSTNHDIKSKQQAQDQQQEYIQQYIIINDYIQQKINVFVNNFQYKNIRTLEDYQDCILLKNIIQKYNKNNNQKYVLPQTKTIIIQNQTNQCYNIFNKAIYPNMVNLLIIFDNKFNDSQQNFVLFPNNMSQLQILRLHQINLIPNSFLQMLRRQKFYNLLQFTIYKTKYTQQNFQVLFQENKNVLKRIRILNIILASISDVQFLIKYQLKLRTLSLNGQFIGKNIYKLQNLNFQFMKNFRMVADKITNEQLLKFLQPLGQKHKPVFPKIQQFSLFWNQINTTGIKKIFQLGIPMVTNFQMLLNKDPNIVNTILGANQSHRLKQLVIYRNQQDSVDPNLNLKNTRQLNYLYMQVQYLQASDFKALSKMDFRSLQSLILVFSKFFQCETFDYIRKIAIHVQKISVVFQNEASSVTSECLNGTVNSQYYLKHLSYIVLACMNYVNCNLRNFFDMLILDQVITDLVLEGVYPSYKSLRKLAVQANLQYLRVLALKFNDLTDDVVIMLLDRQYPQLQFLQLLNNPRLTSKCLKSMANKTYYSLVVLSISHTSIDDIGIEYISTSQFPALNTLGLANTQITGKAIDIINKLKAPNLIVIDLSTNNLKGEDLLKLNITNFKYLKQIIINPQISSAQYIQLDEYYNKNRLQKDKIKINTQIVNFNLVVDQQSQ